MNSAHHECPTELSSLSSGSHDRERREERHIQKIDLPRAKRYDMKEETHNGREKYTYGGVVFIYDQKRNQEVTTFLSNDISLATSNTGNESPGMTKDSQFQEI